MSRSECAAAASLKVLVVLFILNQPGACQAVLSAPATVSPGQTCAYTVNVGAPNVAYWVDVSFDGTVPGMALPLTNRTIPLNPPYWMAGLYAHVVWPSYFQNFVGVTDANGMATASLNIPNDPSLAGIVLYSAMITADWSSPDYVGIIGGPVQTTIVPAPPPTGPLTAPSGLSVTDSTPTSVSLGWQDNSTNESGFKVHRRIGSGSWVLIATTVANVTTYVDPTVTPSTTYSYRVRATNQSGDSSYSNTVTLTTPAAPPTVPTAPTGLGAVAAGATLVNLSWLDNSGNETAFVVERRITGGSFATIATLGSNATNYADSAVAASTSYDYRVASSNTAGQSAYSNVASATTPAAGGGTTTTISQFGITWTFSQPVTAGQFANGDWWVVGPISISSINPPSTSVGGRIVNGAQVNPMAGTLANGFDSQLYQGYQGQWGADYVPSLNRAYGVTPSSPLVLNVGSSLVSTISLSPPGQWNSISTAAVLTVLSSAAPAGAFRPAYAGTNKAIQFNKSQIDYTQLGSLASVAGTPSLSSVEATVERVWLDHINGWLARFHHPVLNMEDYGRDMADAYGIGTLLANMNFTNAQKETLVIRLIQIGIDTYGIALNGGGGNWSDVGGGVGSGRKWRILFAGIMLNDSAMKGVSSTHSFAEDDQTFHVAQTSPGVINNGYGGYSSANLGMAEWGEWHSSDPSLDNGNWNANSYRVCCTANAWSAQALSVRVMGEMGLWAHPAFFDYQDRYMNVMASNGSPAWERAWSTFCATMWDTYRSQY